MRAIICVVGGESPAPLVEIGEGVVVTVTGDHAQIAVKASRDAARRGDLAVPKGVS